jgi:hypothetical protein
MIGRYPQTTNANFLNADSYVLKLDEYLQLLATNIYERMNIYQNKLTRQLGMVPIDQSEPGSSVSSLTMDWIARVQSPTEPEDFSSSLCIQTGSGAHAASYIMGTRSSFPGSKGWPGDNADHSPPSSAKVKKEYELYLLSPKVPSWCVMGLFYLPPTDQNSVNMHKTLQDILIP